MRHIAIIGLGFVADFYMSSLSAHPDVDVKAICDRDSDRVDLFTRHWRRTRAQTNWDDVHVSSNVEDMLAGLSPGDVVLNLTNPGEHYEVSRRCLEAGMHVWSEKPLAMKMDEARSLSDLARSRDLILASAPCSVLGETAQTFCAAIRAGVGGPTRLVYAELEDGFISQAPTEKWFSASGAAWPREDEFIVGCTLEHAGYWLAWLIAAFGPLRTIVAASASIVPDTVQNGGTAAPDMSVGILFFESGVVARLTCSIVASHDHRLRAFCDKGVLEMGAAWNNSAPVRFRRRFRVRRRLVEHPLPRRIRLAGASQPKVGHKIGSPMNFMLGPVEMLEARDEGRPCRLGGDYALHLTEAALALHEAGETGGAHTMTTTCQPMTPMPWAQLR